MNQKVALRLLERLGYSADVASNGLEAIEALERRPYDVVLMDVQMPELDGLEPRAGSASAGPRSASAHHRDDGERDARGPRGVLRGRHGRLRREADPCRGAGASALKRVQPLANGDGGTPAVRARQPRRRRAREPARARRRRLPRRGDRHVPRGRAGAARDPSRARWTSRDSRGAAAGGAHAEVERRDARRRRSSPSCAASSSSARRRAELDGASEPRRPDRAGVRARSSEALAALRSEAADVSDRARAAGTILVADDNRVNRLLLGRSLEQQGHTVVFAENGREALDLLRQQRFDLLLLDVLMPELDGYQVLAELQDDPHLRDIPVVMTSALDELDSVVQLHRDGRRGLPDEAGQPGAAERAGQREPREEAPARPAARADQQVRHQGGGRRPAHIGLLARRQARRGIGDVLRHPLVHDDRGGAGAVRDDRAAERLLHADDGRDRRRRRHRQPDDRRRPDGDLRRAGAARGSPAGGGARRAARWSS